MMVTRRLKILFALTTVFVAASSAQDLIAPATPSGVKSISYELHADITWQQNSETDLAGYKIYRYNGTTYELASTVKKIRSFYWEWYGASGVQKKYKVSAFDFSGNESSLSSEASVLTHQMTDNEFLDMTQLTAFRYFWDWGDPNSGLARERWHPNESDVTNTLGGGGFGVMAIIVGIERGFITRDQGVQRLLKITDFLKNKASRFHGVFPHWIDGSTGKVIKFGVQDGGDLVETAFMIEGLLTTRQYFNKQNSDEEQIRDRINSIWQEVDWDFFRNGSTGLYWNWSPTMGFNFSDTFIFHGWNETLIAYILSIISPTKAVTIPALSFYRSGWGNGDKITSTKSYYGFPLSVGTNYGGPLFFTHYSFLGFDPRNKRDWYTNYYEHNKNQSMVNRAYCIDNPQKFAGYNENCWGLTASYSIPGINYLAHEPANDNGTITPTAALSAMPYTPNESIAALKFFYRTYGSNLWGDFGFKDAFNIGKLWFSDGYLAIDQGPIICMIENYRSQLLWNYFMSSPELKSLFDFSSGKGLFFIDGTDVKEEKIPLDFKLNDNYPNPFNPATTISYQIAKAANVTLKIYDALGNEVAKLVDEYKQPGIYNSQFLPKAFLSDNSRLPSGIYFYQLRADGFVQTKKMILLK
jgi:hypothetical protein